MAHSERAQVLHRLDSLWRSHGHPLPALRAKPGPYRFRRTIMQISLPAPARQTP